MSSCWRSYSSATSVKDMPPASFPRTRATGTRVPRMTAFPKATASSTVMRGASSLMTPFCHTGSLHPEVPGIRMVEHQRGDARLGVHHVPFGELDPDLLRLESAEQLPLEGEVRAGRIAEAVPLALVARGELVFQADFGGVGATPGGAAPGGARL